MELALALVIGALTAAGVYLLLRSRSFDMILGLTLLSYATNLLIFSAGRLVVGKPPVLKPGVETVLANYTDPLPQALVLTAIVIAFAMTAVTIVSEPPESSVMNDRSILSVSIGRRFR